MTELYKRKGKNCIYPSKAECFVWLNKLADKSDIEFSREVVRDIEAIIISSSCGHPFCTTEYLEFGIGTELITRMRQEIDQALLKPKPIVSDLLEVQKALKWYMFP